MRWYNGGIADAITASKSKGAVFVVYIEGKDEISQQITNQIETTEVGSQLGSDNFVAIKLEANSVPHQQFSEIYKQTPVPSIYFIGKNGVPLKIITQTVDASSLSKELDDILEKAGVSPLQTGTQSAASASQSFINTEQTITKPPPDVVCENGVCTIKRSPEPSISSQPEGEDTSLSNEEKIERAQKLLEAKRLEKEREEKENERRKELERRKMGQEVQKMKKMQEDQEMKQLKEERDREKRMEKEARDRVLAQIAQDRADRAAKFQPTASSTPTNQDSSQPTGSSTTKSDTARLQFKLPDGSSKTQEFPSSDKLISVVNYIKANLNLPSNKFTLSTTFPRRQFAESDHEQTLVDLQLTPNAVILVLPLSHGTISTNQGPGGFSGFIWTLLAPLIGIFTFIKSFLGFGDMGHVSGDEPSTSSGGYSGGNSKPENPAEPKKPSDSTTIRKQGNVRRLADIRKDDDENNTWNGNSTQQM